MAPKLQALGTFDSLAPAPRGDVSREYDYDFLIVGSGFGGSVCALRLVEKGYRVLVVEKGRRFEARDFAKSNWNLKRWLWAPALGCHGIFQIRPFSHVWVLAGAGVGGGSLTYANTLPEPAPGFFGTGPWAKLADWRRELEPHYHTARRMLGATTTGYLSPGDRVLQQVAEERGTPEAFEQPPVAIFTGEPGKTVADPYFDGLGPARTGCTRCGACMIGCRVGAKNTLDKNYLHLAKQRGLSLEAEAEVIDVQELAEGGYAVEVRFGYGIRRRQRIYRTRRVIFAAGALGTNALLLRLKARGRLPRLSERVGHGVLTNSESLIGVTVSRSSVDYSQGIAINSLLQLDPDTHVEVVRYPKGSGFFRLLALPHVPGQGSLPVKLARLVAFIVTHPLQTLRAWLVRDWAASTLMLLYMRAAEATLRLERGWFGIMNTRLASGPAPTAYQPQATEIALRVAELLGGLPMSLVQEPLFNIPTTAHILGGCSMAATPEQGVIDSQHRVFGYEGLFVIDGSALSANPGVNPSLTITAMAERAMGFIPLNPEAVAPRRE